MKGMATCKVCGRDFALMEEEHYIVRDNAKTGISAAISSDEEKLFDAYDCPHCGSQYIAQERKRLFIDLPPFDEEITTDDPFEDDLK